MTSYKKAIKIILLFGLFFFAFQSFGQGCSQCKMLSQQGAELDEASFGSNINWGILYLLIIPYILLMFLFRKNIVSLLKRLIQK
jgi:hypothetical protein